MSQSLRSQVFDSTNKSQPHQDKTPKPLTSSAGQGRHTRQTHSGSISEMGSCSLLDVLHQVPTLPGILTADSQKALSATCKSCHIRFIAQVQVVTVGRKEDYAWVLERKWPRLSMVIVLREAPYYMSFPGLQDCFIPQSSNTMICCLRVETSVTKQAVISLLRPQHNDSAGVSWTLLAAQQLAHQLRTRWSMMCSLTVSVVHHTDRLSVEIVSQLVRYPWTRLTGLCLSGCKLKAEGIFHLVQGNWPCLTYLDVSGNCLNAAGMARLASANWPLLETVIISFHCTMGANTIANLCLDTGNRQLPWPPRTLYIKDMPISADMAAELADLQLPEMRPLYLESALVFSKLAWTDWPLLGVLSIRRDDPGALGVLLGYKLEKLQELKFLFDSEKVYHRRVVAHPGVGLWLKLKWIETSYDDVRLLLTGSTKV